MLDFNLKWSNRKTVFDSYVNARSGLNNDLDMMSNDDDRAMSLILKVRQQQDNGVAKRLLTRINNLTKL